jgi:hypothetical protein
MSDTIDEIAARIRQRIRPVCPHMPDDEFNELTWRMAEIEHRYDQTPLIQSTFPPDVARRNKDTSAGGPG